MDILDDVGASKLSAKVFFQTSELWLFNNGSLSGINVQITWSTTSKLGFILTKTLKCWQE